MKNILSLFALVIAIHSVEAQTVGLQQSENGNLDNGYVLFAPISSRDTFLIDKCGKEVHRWSSNNRPGQSVYLLENGDLLRTGNVNNQTFDAGGRGGLVEIIAWDATVKWSYQISSTTELQHHDVKMMPNGNVLIISWDLKTSAEAIAQGRNPSTTSSVVWSEKIIEVEPVGSTGGNIVWEWYLWDHLTQEFDASKPNYVNNVSSPDRVDLNYNATANQPDWIHFNSVDYNESLDQILISVHNLDEVWIIDHSTTTAQAATANGGNSGKGGDILYRWGNPAAYGNGTTADQKLYGQHNAYWIQEGFPYENQIIIFNNGLGRNFSSVEIIDAPAVGFNYNGSLPFGPATASYSYNADNSKNLYAQNISGSQLLSNGNVLICSGPTGEFIEVDPAGNTVWKYKNPVNGQGAIAQGSNPTQNAVFRATFYPADYAGFDGLTLVPGNTIENSNTQSATCKTSLSVTDASVQNAIQLYPNPAGNSVTINHQAVLKSEKLEIFNATGQLIKTQSLVSGSTSSMLEISDLSNGLYFLKLAGNKNAAMMKLMVSH